MRYYKEYSRIIATKEKSSGNDTVGDMWTETKSFDKSERIEKIIEWAKDCSGKLTITIDESGTEKASF